MESENKEFFDLLKSTVATQALLIKLTNGQTYAFKALSTFQFKEIIKTVIDSSATQASFNEGITKIMLDNKPSDLTKENIETLNLLDKLLFILENRIQTISSTVPVQANEEKVELNLNSLKEQIYKEIDKEDSIFLTKKIIHENFELLIGLPSIKSEDETNNTVYKNVNLNSDNPEELEQILGTAFISEIAKFVKQITIHNNQTNENQELNLEGKSIQNRIQVIEQLPASLIQLVLVEVENLKKRVESILTVDGVILAVDGTLFSIR